MFENKPQAFWYDDPTFSDLITSLPLPPEPPLNFSVDGFSGGGFDLGTQQAQAAGCYLGMCNALSYIMDKTKNPLQQWAATTQLIVVPRAGFDFNAYYDRSAIRLFFKPDPTTGKMVYTCEATVVYVHELGHAVLDMIRPDFWSTACLEVHAYHESFADCFAILNLLTYDPVIQKTMQQTSGMLRQSNTLSQLAVELGTAIFRYRRPLRDAFNNFLYVIPDNLPGMTTDDKLCQEPHNFSRVWTGTFYDMLVSIYERLVSQGQDQIAALKNSRDACAKYLMYATAIAPTTPRFFDGLTRAILAVDAANGSPYQDTLNQVFARHQILQMRVVALADRRLEDVQPGEKDEVLKSTAATAVCLKNNLTMRLADSAMLLPQDDNPLYEVEVELPADRYFQFNDKGELVEEIQPDMPDILDAVLSTLQYIHENDMVGPGKPWAVVGGKLVRQRSCNEGSYVNNSMVKGAPEYGKPWKPQNNAGCCSTCKPKKHEAPNPIRLGCVIRDRSCQGTGTVRVSQLVRTKGC